jgi:NAD(P)-dependent dehydrogenase (short-subunit alcohol dehydrogenase family)
VLAPVNPGHCVPGGEVLLPQRPTPQDVASAVAYLLDAPAVTGQILAVDSGQSLLMR